MVKTKGGVSSKHSDKSPYFARDNIERAYFAANHGREYFFKRTRNMYWNESYNDAIALYRYVLARDNYKFDDVLTNTGTIYDDKIDDFMEANLIFDDNFNREAFNIGRNHAIRIIKLKDKEIKLEYLDDFVDTAIISEFQEYLNNSKKIGGR